MFVLYINKMSIYSGFPTRKDETNYNNLLINLLQTMQNHLLEFITPSEISEYKSDRYNRILLKMQIYEQHKYLPPKFTTFLKPLMQIIGMPVKVSALPQQNTSKLNFNIKTKYSNSYNAFNEQTFRNNKNTQESFDNKNNQINDEQCLQEIKKKISLKGGQTQRSDNVKILKIEESMLQAQQRKINKINFRYKQKIKNVYKKQSLHSFQPSDVQKKRSYTQIQDQIINQQYSPNLANNQKPDSRKKQTNLVYNHNKHCRTPKKQHYSTNNKNLQTI